MTKLILPIVAFTVVASCNAFAQQCPIAQHCFECSRQQAMARYRAGNPNQVRLANEARRRGGSLQAVQSLRGTRDYQSSLYAVRRACGCLRPGC
jgi:hypothetical protein